MGLYSLDGLYSLGSLAVSQHLADKLDRHKISLFTCSCMKMILLRILPFWSIVCTVTTFTITYSNVHQVMKWTEQYPNRFVKDIQSADDQHTLALLRWKNNPMNTYELTVRTHAFDSEVYTKVCNVSSPFGNSSEWVTPETISILKSNLSVLIYWKETDKIQGIYIAIFTMFDVWHYGQFVEQRK